MTDFERARAWFDQARSDARTGEALLACSPPMLERDVGCHVAVMCAQAVEKSLKGYLYFNGTTPEMSHRPDKYLVLLLDHGKFLRYRNHHRELGRLFDHETKARLRGLLDLTPGGRGNRTDLPNTESPWSNAHGIHVPAGHAASPAQSTPTARKSPATAISGSPMIPV